MYSYNKRFRKMFAKKDIVVWKHIINIEHHPAFRRIAEKFDGTLKTKYLSSYYSREIYFNKETCSQITIAHTMNREIIEAGLHSYKYKKDAENQAKFYKETLVKCIIPEGTTYYTGFFSNEYSAEKIPNYVSDKLIYTEVIKEFQLKSTKS